MKRIEVDKGVHIYQRGNVCWVDIVRDGKRVQRTLGTTDEKKARTIARQLADAVISGTWNIAVGTSYTVEQAMKDYRPKRGGQNQSTRRNIAQILKRWSAWLAERGITLLDRVTRLLLEEYRDWLLAEKFLRGTKRMSLSSATVNEHIGRIGSLLRWAKASGYLRMNPAEGLGTLPVMRRVKRVLTSDEIAEIAVKCSETYRDVILFTANVGCRISEALALIGTDTDGKSVTITSTKTYQQRTVPLNAVAAGIAGRRRLASGGGLLFPSAAGTPLNRDNVRRAMHTAAVAAGINSKEATPHALRRSFATVAAQQVPMPVLVRLGGWKDGRVLMQHYVGRVEKAPPIVAR